MHNKYLTARTELMGGEHTPGHTSPRPSRTTGSPRLSDGPRAKISMIKAVVLVRISRGRLHQPHLFQALPCE